jgi:hypothetical protein
VHNGQIVLDEPAELQEGTELEVLLPESEDLAELESAISASKIEFERGDVEDARTLLARLRARS